MRHLLVTALGIAVLFGVAAFIPTPRWPPVQLPKNVTAHTKRPLAIWSEKPVTAVSYFKHEPLGLYLHRGPFKLCEPGEDSNPLMTAQCGLRAYGWALQPGNDGETSVRQVADKLIAMQDERGGLPYQIKKHHRAELSPGWVSAIAQGKALSFFARAYTLTRDSRYLDAGRKTLDFMLLPVSEGGVMTSMAALDPSLTDFVFFEEYPTQPANYTLNGYMFALFGLYDWSKVSGGDGRQELAARYFDRGIETLTHILPYYDLGTISTYDLGHLTFEQKPIIKTGYHVLHTLQLHALFEITGKPELEEFSQKWLAYAIDAGRRKEPTN